MDDQRFEIGQGHSLSVRDWMQSITDGTVPDALTTLDSHLHKSIGGFGVKVENIANTNRGVPIFEFRGIPVFKTPETIKFAKDIDKNVVDLHRRFTTKPSRL